MYLPPQFKPKDPAVERTHALALMRAYPFAALISTDDSGFPFVSHIPLHAPETDAADSLLSNPIMLLGHVAKANPHWCYLASRPQALVSFMGPYAYMSPTVYPDLLRVPTWTYLSVECHVTVKLIEEPAAKDRLLKKLIADHEPAYAQQWRGLGEEFAYKMLAGIAAFELEVTKLDCKLKLNQHRPEAHAAMRKNYAQGNEAERVLAQWMDKLGLVGN